MTEPQHIRRRKKSVYGRGNHRSLKKRVNTSKDPVETINYQKYPEEKPEQSR
jgi:hypothetical protein